MKKNRNTALDKVIHQKFNQHLVKDEKIIWSATFRPSEKEATGIDSIIQMNGPKRKLIINLTLITLAVILFFISPITSGFIACLLATNFVYTDIYKSIYPDKKLINGKSKTDNRSYIIFTNLGYLSLDNTFTRIPFNKINNLEIKSIKNEERLVLKTALTKHLSIEKALIVQGKKSMPRIMEE